MHADHHNSHQFLHITRTRLTTAFFIFILIHCFAQVLIQTLLHFIDNNASSFASSILAQAQVPSRNFAWLTQSDHGTNLTLQLCSGFPQGKAVSPCVTVFETGVQNIQIPEGFRRRDVSGVKLNSIHIRIHVCLISIDGR